MQGRGRPPGDNAKPRPGRAASVWTYAEGPRWVGEVPAPPDGLTPGAGWAWNVWFTSWYSWFWTPSDLPQIVHAIKLYDAFEQGKLTVHAELRRVEEALGITPRGQQTLRRKPMREESISTLAKASGESRYGHLQLAPEADDDDGGED